MPMLQADARSILIIDDDADAAETVSSILESAGYTSTALPLAPGTLAEIQQAQPDLVVLDVSRSTGLELLQQLRTISSLPLIAIDEGERRARVDALEAGADDVLSEPIAREELVARVHALLRRIERMPPAEDRVVVRQLELNVSRRSATLAGRRLHLTPIEYSLLLHLARNAGRPVSHAELLQAVWGSSQESDYSVLRVNISRLRQKLEDNPRHPTCIVTVPGEGYVLDPVRRPR